MRCLGRGNRYKEKLTGMIIALVVVAKSIKSTV